MASSFSNNNTPITLNLRNKSYKIPVSKNVSQKAPTKKEMTSKSY